MSFTLEEVAAIYERQGKVVPESVVVERRPGAGITAPAGLGVGATVKNSLTVGLEPTAPKRPRHVTGRMNGLEARFLEEIVEPQVAAGEVLHWHFEAVKLRLAPKTWLTLDFWLVLRNGKVVAPEVKGYWEDDARVKVKLAAELFPWLHVQAWTWKKAQGWKREEF